MHFRSRFRALFASSAAVLLGGAGLAIATAVPTATPAGAVTCTINGTAGNDVINVTTAGAVVCAGAGDDTVTMSSSATSVTVYGGDGNDTIVDHGGDGNLYGENGDDVIDASTIPYTENIWGGPGNDTIQGGPAGENIDGGTGADKIDSGGVTLGGYPDHLSYADATAGVTVNLETGANSDGDTTLTGAPLTGAASGFEVVVGGNFNDVLTGDAADNILDGGTGNDTFDGGSGGNDTVTYEFRTSKVIADLSAGFGGQGTEHDTYTNIDNLVGGSGSDVLTGDSHDNVLTGGAGANTLTGGAGNDTLVGGDSGDTLDGGTGSDAIYGWGGNDELIYSGRSPATTVTATLDASGPTTNNGEPGENDFISLVEDLTGGPETDVFTGSTANDKFDPGLGSDTVVGGGGNDTMIYADAGRTLPVSATLDAAATTTGNGQSGENDSLTGIRNLTGGSEDDTFVGSTANNVLDGGGGNNSLSGGDGNDTLRADTGNDTFRGGNGTDDVDYGGRTAIITASIDLTSVSPATPTCDDGQSGEFDCIASDVENLDGGGKNDVLIGNDVANVLTGNGGTNTLYGGDGDDTLNSRGFLYGQEGNDTLIAPTGSDTLDGGNGSDTASYSTRTAANPITADLSTGVNTESDIYTSIENLIGGAGNDTLIGDGGHNTLSGKAGDDTLVGRGDTDILDGGPGTNDVAWGDEMPSTTNTPGDTCTNAETTYDCP